MRIDEDMDRRLRNWARWTLERIDGARVGSAGLGERVDGEGWDAQTVVPTCDAEAEETAQGLRRLAQDQQSAVAVWYVHSGTVAMRCRKAGCSETELRTRVCLAQRALAQWLVERHEAAKIERRRVETLQRLAARA